MKGPLDVSIVMALRAAQGGIVVNYEDVNNYFNIKNQFPHALSINSISGSNFFVSLTDNGQTLVEQNVDAHIVTACMSGICMNGVRSPSANGFYVDILRLHYPRNTINTYFKKWGIKFDWDTMRVI